MTLATLLNISFRSSLWKKEKNCQHIQLWQFLFFCVHKWQFQNVSKEQFWQIAWLTDAKVNCRFLGGNLSGWIAVVLKYDFAAEAGQKKEKHSWPHSKGAKRCRCILKEIMSEGLINGWVWNFSLSDSGSFSLLLTFKLNCAACKQICT